VPPGHVALGQVALGQVSGCALPSSVSWCVLMCLVLTDITRGRHGQAAAKAIQDKYGMPAWKASLGDNRTALKAALAKVK
jgi:hypothetical protein